MKEMALAGYKKHGDFSSPKQFSATDIKLINNKKHYGVGAESLVVQPEV
jgi:hypothetical protein